MCNAVPEKAYALSIWKSSIFLEHGIITAAGNHRLSDDLHIFRPGRGGPPTGAHGRRYLAERRAKGSPDENLTALIHITSSASGENVHFSDIDETTGRTDRQGTVTLLDTLSTPVYIKTSPQRCLSQGDRGRLVRITGTTARVHIVNARVPTCTNYLVHAVNVVTVPYANSAWLTYHNSRVTRATGRVRTNRSGAGVRQ